MEPWSTWYGSQQVDFNVRFLLHKMEERLLAQNHAGESSPSLIWHTTNDRLILKLRLDYQVITVPGIFFDVNPGRRRARRPSRFRHHVRFSFGPAIETLIGGLDRLEKMITDLNSA